MLNPVERDDRVGAPEEAAQHPQLLVAHIIAPAAIDATGQDEDQHCSEQCRGDQDHAGCRAELNLEQDFRRQRQRQQDQCPQDHADPDQTFMGPMERRQALVISVRRDRFRRGRPVSTGRIGSMFGHHLPMPKPYRSGKPVDR